MPNQLMKVNFKNKAYFIMHSVAVVGSGRVFTRSLIDRFAGGDSAHNEIAILAENPELIIVYLLVRSAHVSR